MFTKLRLSRRAASFSSSKSIPGYRRSDCCEEKLVKLTEPEDEARELPDSVRPSMTTAGTEPVLEVNTLPRRTISSAMVTG